MFSITTKKRQLKSQKIVCWLLFCWLFVGQNDAAAIKPCAAASFHISGSAAKSNFKDQTAQSAIEKTKILVAAVIKDSFPELKNASFKIKSFRSKTSYFRTSFSFARLLSGRKLHYKIFVNPQVFELNAPPAGIRAILAHELSHLLYYQRHNRFELFGLIRLTQKSFTVRFERGADLEAIKRGYGEGLKSYRNWLYQNIPVSQLTRKKSNYLTPEEIELISNALKQKPELIDYWRRNVPRNLAEIRATLN